MSFKISSRQSPLAKIQAYQVGEALKKAHPAQEIEYFFRQSLGDQNLTEPLWKIPEKGVFTEDFYQDLVSGETDMVVHSWKDLPTEEKDKTRIAATLARADQRDLLLFKKESSQKKKKNLQIFSSSPRRTVNLSAFLPEILPWPTESLQFLSVRGNISTRVQKLLENPDVDGLIVAKAAMDRLLSDGKFPETVDFLRASLEKLRWMVLPLCENPNAAAQGALAIEIHRQNAKLEQALTDINCEISYQSSQREREILKEFGGGCHLAIGVSVLHRNYGRLEIVKGLTPEGKTIQDRKFFPHRRKPAGMKIGRLEFESHRQPLNCERPTAEALFISRAEALMSGLDGKWIWTAGLKTWKKLAAQGVWVHGCAEGLGECEDPRIEILAGRKLSWQSLTHEGSLDDEESDHKSVDHDGGSKALKTRLPVYQLDLKLRTASLPAADAWMWKSASEFHLAVQSFPVLKNQHHICGPGRTFEKIKKTLGSEENIFVELNDEFITVV